MDQTWDFPEVSEYLEKMQVRKSLFGYDKEDVMLKMQQLNRLYQERMLQMKGQLEETQRAARAEAEGLRRQAAEEKEALRCEMEKKLARMVTQIHQEEKEAVLAEMEEKRLLHKKELHLVANEMHRISEQLQDLQERVEEMTETFLVGDEEKMIHEEDTQD